VIGRQVPLSMGDGQTRQGVQSRGGRGLCIHELMGIYGSETDGAVARVGHPRGGPARRREDEDEEGPGLFLSSRFQGT